MFCTFSQKLLVSADDQSLTHVSVRIPDFDRPPSTVRVTWSGRRSPLLKDKCFEYVVKIIFYPALIVLMFPDNIKLVSRKFDFQDEGLKSLWNKLFLITNRKYLGIRIQAWRYPNRHLFELEVGVGCWRFYSLFVLMGSAVVDRSKGKCFY